MLQKWIHVQPLYLNWQSRGTRPLLQTMVTVMLAALSLTALSPAYIASAKSNAHPLGNFTINHYSRLEIGSKNIQVLYIVDRAEIPTFQERSKIDTNQDDVLSDSEKSAYLQAEIEQYQSNLQLRVNGAPAVFKVTSSQIDFPEGQSGLLTQRITAHLETSYVAGVADQDSISIDYNDNNFAGRIGWREIVLKAGDGVTLQGSNLPTSDISNELRNYPQDMLQSPIQTSQISFGFVTTSDSPSANSQNQTPSPALQSQITSSTDPFASLINIPELTLGTALLAVLGAFFWGGMHALSPGHGKTIVAAYVVGQRATIKHAMFLGATTTLTHTAGVFALGLITLFASQYIVPEQLYPWLEVVSGVVVAVLGATLLRGRIAGLLQWLGVLGKPQVVGANHANVDALDLHDHGDGFAHRHGLPTQKLGWRSLLALGISGGLLPCPSALVVMLGAIGLQRVGFGLLLIVVFSLGLASVLIAIGILLVRAGATLERLSTSRYASLQPLIRALPRVAPVASACVITVAGVIITVRALAAAGLISI